MFLTVLLAIAALLNISILVFGKRIGLGFRLAIVVVLIIVGCVALIFLALIASGT
jgi:hypothetical protein